MKVIIFVSALVLAANAAPFRSSLHSNGQNSNILVRVDDSVFGNSEPVYPPLTQPQQSFRLVPAGGGQSYQQGGSSGGSSGGGYSFSQPIQSRSFQLNSGNSGGNSGYSAPATQGQTLTLRRVEGSAPSGGSYGYTSRSSDGGSVGYASHGSYSQPTSYTLRSVGNGNNGGYNGGQQYTSQSSGGYSHTYSDEGSKPFGSEYINQVLGLIERQ